jgi:uncharacterized membrane protein
MAMARPDLLDRAFRLGIVLKGLDGLLELAGGLLLLVVSPAAIAGVAEALTRHDLSVHPDDVFARRVLQLAEGLTGPGVRFAAAYLLLHGLTKVVLVVALLRGQLWAYPWMIAFLLLFIGYQLYRFVLEPSAWLILLSAFDLAVAWLTWREYLRHRQRRPRPHRHPFA